MAQRRRALAAAVALAALVVLAVVVLSSGDEAGPSADEQPPPAADEQADTQAGPAAELAAELSTSELACAPAHFPGLGATLQDPRQGPAPVGLDLESLAARDLQPFDAAFAERAPAVVLSLATYAASLPDRRRGVDSARWGARSATREAATSASPTGCRVRAHAT